MQHLIREDARGMLSLPEALWLQEAGAPGRASRRGPLVPALLALAARLAPAVTNTRRGRWAAGRAG